MWVPVPDELPFACAITGASAASDGPFFKHDVQFRDAGDPDRVVTLFFSVGALRLMADSLGSPVMIVDRRVWDELNRSLADSATRLQDTRFELNRLRESIPVDVDALADRLVDAMSDRFARKTGPKPRGA